MTNLNDLFDAWDKTTGGGRDAEKARQICHDYIAEHPGDFEEFDDLLDTMSPEDVCEYMVGLVDKARLLAYSFREAGMEDEARTADDHKLRCDVWIMSRIDPQNIGGATKVTVRIP